LEDVNRFYAGESTLLLKTYRWGYPFMSLFRLMTDVFYGFAANHFSKTRYGWWQKGFCQFLYGLMFLNWPNRGNQLVGIFQKLKT
jgi:hypothetical protein